MKACRTPGRGLRGAGPRALPHRPGHRGAGHRPRPRLAAAGPAHRQPAGALRAVGFLDRRTWNRSAGAASSNLEAIWSTATWLGCH